MNTDKYEHGLIEVYDRLIDEFKPKSLLEIGVYHGGSLEYYGGKIPLVVGIDISDQPKTFDPHISFHKMDGTTDAVLSLGRFDFVVDDGSHKEADMRKTFNLLWPQTNILYVIEDWGVGYKQSDTFGRTQDFIEELKTKYRVETHCDDIRSYAIIYKK